MKSRRKNNFIVIILTIFVVLAFIGFSYSSFATALPGQQLSTTKISVGDSSVVFALADTNYLQGGHMQVPNRHTLLHDGLGTGTLADSRSLTSERRSVGMLVTVVDDRFDSADLTAGHTMVTYRLISIPHDGSLGHDAPCGVGTSPATDSSLDGVDTPDIGAGNTACTSTTLDLSGSPAVMGAHSNWRVVIPDVLTGTPGQFLLTDSLGNITAGAGGAGTGTVTSIIAGNGLAGGTITTSGTISLDLTHANIASGTGAWTGQQEFGGTDAPIISSLVSGGSTAGGVLYTDATGLMERVDGTTDSHLTLHGGAHPSWSAIDLASDVTGLLPLSALDATSCTDGQILTYDAGAGHIVCADNNGGPIDFGSTPVSIPGFPSDAAGATDLKDFVKNMFFPAVGPTGTLSIAGVSGTTDYEELGSSPTLTLKYHVLKHRNTVASYGINLAITGGSGSILSCTGAAFDCPGGDDTGSSTSLDIFAEPAITGGTPDDGGRQPLISYASDYSRSASTDPDTDTDFTLSITPTTGPAANGTLVVHRVYLPRVYYGMISTATNLEDITAFPDGDATLNSDIQSLSHNPLQSTRAVSSTAFTGTSAYVYFAWPTTYEPVGNCKAVDAATFADVGTFDCFSSGSTPSLFNLTDMVHRTLTGYVNASGEAISYELYRAHFALSGGGGTFYFRVQ